MRVKAFSSFNSSLFRKLAHVGWSLIPYRHFTLTLQDLFSHFHPFIFSQHNHVIRLREMRRAGDILGLIICAELFW